MFLKTFIVLLFLIRITKVPANLPDNSIVVSRIGYRDDDFYVLVLFYADDELLLDRSCEEPEEIITIVIEVAGECKYTMTFSLQQGGVVMSSQVKHTHSHQDDFQEPCEGSQSPQQSLLVREVSLLSTLN